MFCHVLCSAILELPKGTIFSTGWRSNCRSLSYIEMRFCFQSVDATKTSMKSLSVTCGTFLRRDLQANTPRRLFWVDFKRLIILIEKSAEPPKPVIYRYLAQTKTSNCQPNFLAPHVFPLQRPEQPYFVLFGSRSQIFNRSHGE